MDVKDDDTYAGLHDSMAGKIIPLTTVESGTGHQVKPDVFYFPVQVVNIVFVGSKDDWTLVDAGMPGSAEKIVKAVEDHFGKGAKPKNIILTHGHFDHVGGLVDLVKKWKVPVYAHEKELPFLTGKTDYPKPDSSVSGGLVAKMAGLFPNEAIDLKSHVHALPSDGSVPGMRGWRWVHTPGHTPGHVVLFRDEDRVLLAGDAFCTVHQDALWDVVTQSKEISGPPRYFTTNWPLAWESVRTIEELRPDLVVASHGKPMEGEELRKNLRKLVEEFDKVSIPKHGKFIDNPM